MTYDAREILRERLTPGQQRDLDRNNGFNVRGNDGKVYRLLISEEGFVYGPISRLTARTNGWTASDYPSAAYGFFAVDEYDVWLADPYEQALAKLVWIQSNVRTLKRVACKSPARVDPAAYGGDYDGEI